MKKIQSLLIGILLVILVLIFGARELDKSTGMADAKVLNIYNWGDYIDPALLKQFEKDNVKFTSPFKAFYKLFKLLFL